MYILLVGILDPYLSDFAYSVVRKLYTSYSGPAFRLFRNPSTATFIDVNFLSNGLIDEAQIASFIAASPNVDYNVSIIYDQSGNGRNANLTGSGPRYYIGATQTYKIVNGYKVIDFVDDSSGRALTFTQFNAIGKYIFASLQTLSTSASQGIINGSPNQQWRTTGTGTQTGHAVVASAGTSNLGNPTISGQDLSVFGISVI
jgi:hypothetical protein